MSDIYTGFKGKCAPRLRFILGGGAVERFHTVRTLRANTVAEHSFGVAWLCYLLTEGKVSANLLMAALAHDMSEQGTGDIPAPFKRSVLGMRETMSEYERDIMELCGFSFPVSTEEARTLKMADAMDGMLNCLRERQMGNRNLDLIYHKFRSYVSELEPRKGPEADTFRDVQELWSEATANGA